MTLDGDFGEQVATKRRNAVRLLRPMGHARLDRRRFKKSRALDSAVIQSHPRAIFLDLVSIRGVTRRTVPLQKRLSCDLSRFPGAVVAYMRMRHVETRL